MWPFLRQAREQLFLWTGSKVSAQSEKPTVPILMYHSISEHASSKFKQFTVSPYLFAQHMAYLKLHSYTPITVTQYINARMQAGRGLPPHPVILTFDDGFADFYTDALPVLQQYGFPATLYVSTAFVNHTSSWLQYEGETARRIVTWSQLKEISECGIECGAHSHSHPQLDMLPSESAANEVVTSKKLLEDHLGREVLSFAYPFGYYTADVRQLVREAGYTSACAVDFALTSEATDPFALSRMIVRANTDIEALKRLLAGTDKSMVHTMYLRTRRPVWWLVRKSMTLMMYRHKLGIMSGSPIPFLGEETKAL